jgi:hypothetical protein
LHVGCIGAIFRLCESETCNFIQLDQIG